MNASAITAGDGKLGVDRGRAIGPLLLGAIGGSMVAARFETVGICLGITILGAIAAGAPWPKGRWFVALGIGSVTAVLLNLYLTRGAPLPLPTIFGAPATREGLAGGTLMALRMAGALVGLHGLRAAWPGERGADEIAALLRPLQRLRVPIGEARMVLGLALRFAPLLAEEAGRVQRLQDLRAGRPPRGMRERMQRRRAALIPVLGSAIERAERVALTLEARHYRQPPPPAVRPLGWSGVAGLLVLATAIAWRG